MGLATALAGCGMQPQNPAAFGLNGQGFQTGMGWNNPGGWNTGGNIWNNSASQPIYNGNQIVGYRSRQPLVTGTISSNTPLFTHSVQVLAGQKIFANLTNLQYAAYIRCDRNLVDSYQWKTSTRPITNASILLNGQPIGGGYGGNIAVPANGTLTINADLSQNDGIRCGMFGADRPFQVLSYAVSFGAGYPAGYPYTVSSNMGAAIEVERCTGTNGQQIACP